MYFCRTYCMVLLWPVLHHIFVERAHTRHHRTQKTCQKHRKRTHTKIKTKKQMCNYWIMQPSQQKNYIRHMQNHLHEEPSDNCKTTIEWKKYFFIHKFELKVIAWLFWISFKRLRLIIERFLNHLSIFASMWSDLFVCWFL